MIRKRSKTVAEMLRTLVQARAWRCLMHERPQHQDYTYEMGQLRKYLAR